MEQQGIIEPVQSSDWATPVVPLPKPDGSVRLCGDYRVAVNPHLEVDQHPLPKPKDIFSTLNQCKFFAKLDLSQAYMQVTLDEESKKLTTITTHTGLFKFRRLPRMTSHLHRPCFKGSSTRSWQASRGCRSILTTS